MVALAAVSFCGCNGNGSSSGSDGDGSSSSGDTEQQDAVYKHLSFYAINDLHGKFMDTSSQPGVDEMSTYIRNLYADPAREEVLLSSGDMWQGTVESSANRGALMTSWMNEMGFVSMTLGNHEYDWGAATLSPNQQLAEFPFLAINVTDNGRPADYCSPSTVVERDGVKIGIIGAIGNCLSSISGEYTDGLYFATGDELTALVKAESTRLRQEEDCDFIVYSIHDGYESSSSAIMEFSQWDIPHYDVSLSNGYVDLVFEGHTHQYYVGRDDYGVYHLQGGGENRYMSCADVDYNKTTGKFTVTPRLIDRSEYAGDALEGDPVVQDIFAQYFPSDNPYTTVVGYNDYKRTSTEICNQVAKLYFERGTSVWGGTYDIVLGGGYLNTRSPYSLYKGKVTYADLFSLMPFDNAIVLGKIKGFDLKNKFLSNERYYKYMTIGETDVVDSQDYYIIVDTYTSTYKSNRITEVERLSDGKYARDLVAQFIADGGWGRAGRF